jgi:hypothetical protein
VSAAFRAVGYPATNIDEQVADKAKDALIAIDDAIGTLAFFLLSLCLQFLPQPDDFLFQQALVAENRLAHRLADFLAVLTTTHGFTFLVDGASSRSA